MPYHRLQVPHEGHTLGSLLRDTLFEFGATFAACVLNHPEDDFLTVTIEADDPKSTLLMALQHMSTVLERTANALPAA